MAFHTSTKNAKLKDIEELEENAVLERLNSIQAKGRLSFIVPTENQSDMQFLTFRHITKAQEKTRKRQQPIKLEPLVSSKTSMLDTLAQRKLQNCYGGMEVISRCLINKEGMKA